MSDAQATQLPETPPLYEALDGDGYPYTRQAFTVGELPDHLRKAALKKASAVLGLGPLSYGIPVYESLGMEKAEAISDGRPFLMYKGLDLPLDYFWYW